MEKLSSALREVLAVLSKAGKVTITAEVGGRKFQIGVSGEEAAVRPAQRPIARRLKEVDGRKLRREDEAALVDFIHSNPKGRRLEELAMRFGVRPRNKLKPLLRSLLKRRVLVIAGRYYRSARAVVKRGRPARRAA